MVRSVVHSDFLRSRWLSRVHRSKRLLLMPPTSADGVAPKPYRLVTFGVALDSEARIRNEGVL
jgi:hypothetical protein